MALLAAVSMMGMNEAAQSATVEFKLMERDWQPRDVGWEPSRRNRRRKQSAINQRQIRKNRRRRHAAGDKKAFA